MPLRTTKTLIAPNMKTRAMAYVRQKGWMAMRRSPVVIPQAPPSPPDAIPPPIAAHTLFIDNYGGGFIRAQANAVTELNTTIEFILADSGNIGVNGAVYPTLADIPDGAAVWADFAGTLGHVRMDGADVLGSTLKTWITDATILSAQRDNTDPAHPVLVVGLLP